MTRSSAQLAVDWIRQHANTIHQLLPTWQATINRELTVIDGLPTNVGTDTTRSSSESTPVETAVLTRTPITNHVTDITDLLDTTCTVLRGIANDMRRHIGTTPHNIPRCTTLGRDGKAEWADPTCHNVASRGPLCDRCAKAEWRWRKDHGLPPRRDGLFTGDDIA